jgi:hypothetical protein
MKLAWRSLALGAAVLLVPALFQPDQFEARATVGTPVRVLTSTQLASIRSEVLTALTVIDLPLSSIARTKAVETALAQIAQHDATAVGPSALSVIVADAITAGVAPTTAVDGVIRGGVAGGIQRSAAIAYTIEGAVGVGASPANVAAQVLATSGSLKLLPRVTGEGLGIAAATLGVTDLNAARAIAQTVANEGSAETRLAFESQLRSCGAPQTVVVLANQFPIATSEVNDADDDEDIHNEPTGKHTEEGDEKKQNDDEDEDEIPCSGPSCS